MYVILPWQPFLRPKDKKFGNNVLVADHQPEVIDFQILYDAKNNYIEQSYNNIELIIQQNNISVDKVYMESYLNWTEFPYDLECVPLYFFKECLDFLDYKHEYEISDKLSCFIMMNKKRYNRLLVSSWFSYYGKDIDYDYTQGWENTSLDKDLLSCLTKNTKFTDLDTLLPKKYIYIPESDKFNRLIDQVNGVIWRLSLSKLFGKSNVSVITEPVFWEKANMITEKYLMSLYGYCFPIFCGGYHFPKTLENIGFDVFPDVVDHSYQYEKNPVKRVLLALHLNKKLLQEKTHSKLDYIERHQNNLKLVQEDLPKLINKFNCKNPILWQADQSIMQKLKEYIFSLT